MEKKLIVALIEEVFTPLGFRRKGFAWLLRGEELSKITILERSSHSSFNINYGFIIRDLELTTALHVGSLLGGKDRNEQLMVNQLLDLESGIKPGNRLTELKKLINARIVAQFQKINSLNDLYNELNGRPHLNNIPLDVKEYFNF